MNYKYKFQTVDDLPLLQLSAVTILLPASKSENKVSITRSMSLGIDRPETDSTPASIEAIRMSQSPGSF